MSALLGTSLATADRARWESAYRDAFPRVYRGLVAMGASADQAEDALHDAFLKGLSRSNIESVEGWLFVVALRVWRRRRLRERLFLPFAAASRERTSEPNAVDRIALFIALRELPERQRQVLVARYILGLTQEETARALGIARGTVSATTTQAASVLRRALMTEVRK